MNKILFISAFGLETIEAITFLRQAISDARQNHTGLDAGVVSAAIQPALAIFPQAFGLRPDPRVVSDLISAFVNAMNTYGGCGAVVQSGVAG